MEKFTYEFEDNDNNVTLAEVVDTYADCDERLNEPDVTKLVNMNIGDELFNFGVDDNRVGGCSVKRIC